LKNGVKKIKNIKTFNEAFSELHKAVDNLKLEVEKLFLPVIYCFDKHPVLIVIVYIVGFLFVAGVLSFGIYDMTQMILSK
jgi:hypothetical protein